MNFPQFWARSQKGTFSLWRWSNTSVVEAKTLADAALQELMARFKAQGQNSLHHGYYGARPMREPVIREIKGEDGKLAAVITRNAYGCLVLNTSQVMFVDVDSPAPGLQLSVGGIFKSLFGGAKQAASKATSERERVLANAQKILQIYPGWGWRVYQTRAGFRLLATHQLFDPTCDQTAEAFSFMGADPLYVKLCKGQKCFRARLTPKPWRCKAGHPPARWPWESPAIEEKFKRWDERYLAASDQHATCELIAVLGEQSANAAIQPIIEIHDQATRAESKLPLA
jgi:hypothetical protein